MKNNKLSVLGAKLLLMIAAIVWGFAFVAQKVGMESIGPMAFNGIRFIIGSISLLPVIWYFKKDTPNINHTPNKLGYLWKAGVLSGLTLFTASSIQQIGIVYTTAGNAGFITSMYVILVPVFGLFLRQKVNIQTWVGAVIAFAGLYFLTANEGFTLVLGDALVFASAFFWAIQVLLASYYAVRVNILKLASIQFLITGVLSLIVSFFMETYNIQNIIDAIIPILYGGIMSVGLAFTLQLIGQKKVIPSHAAIILSTESLFAVIGGWLLLNEILNFIEILGAMLMLLGIILSQITIKKTEAKNNYS